MTDLSPAMNNNLAKIKVVRCGKIVEVYHTVSVPFRGRPTGKINPSNTRRSDASLRAKRMVRWLSQCNADPEHSYFFTATFADDIQDYDEALIRWKKFRRLLLKEFPYVRYIAVPEVQPRSGRWHFHALFVGLPSLSDLRLRFGTRLTASGSCVDAWQFWFTTLWSQANGSQKIHRANIQAARSVAGVCGYLSKYLSKSIGGVVPSSRKNYYAGGKNLLRPVSLIGQQFVPEGKPVYTASWKGRFGQIETFERFIV